MTPLPGTGDSAFFCGVTTGDALVRTGERSHGQNRTDDVYATLAKTLADRL